MITRAGIDASAHLTMKPTIDANGISRSTTTTGVTCICLPRTLKLIVAESCVVDTSAIAKSGTSRAGRHVCAIGLHTSSS